MSFVLLRLQSEQSGRRRRFMSTRPRTGLTDDGATLVDRTLLGELPLLAINLLKTDSERSEQRGFANLVKGMFGMFRNTTAHAPKISWAIDKDDAEEVFT